MDLFSSLEDINSRPLADRMRPARLDQYVGQKHLLGEGSVLVSAMKTGRLFSFLLWGPPGSGKTTLVRLVAQESNPPPQFLAFSAVLSGVKEIRSVIDQAEATRTLNQRQTLVFIDEIHRFNKAQQDALLPHVERGDIILAGATTENPSFEVISPLLSRLRVFTLQSLSPAELAEIVLAALADTDRGLGKQGLKITQAALEYLVALADGDARRALNDLEVMANRFKENPALGAEMDLPHVEAALKRRVLKYDRAGEEHYNLISALHKSLRDSDPDAGLYWLGRMLLSGEDPLYIARRLVRFASEDVGNAAPEALTLALAAREAYHLLGSPEGELALAQAVVYLACAPKSNAVYRGFQETKKIIAQTGSLPVPLTLRNPVTPLMAGLGYGRGYLYAHDFPDTYVPQEHLPEGLQGLKLYQPTPRGRERVIGRKLAERERKKAGRKAGQTG
jgi:putative ATPase